MEVATGGSGRYYTMLTVVLIVALHAILAFGTLSGVLLDASIIEGTGLSAEQVAVGNSLVFFGWIPGAIIGGPLGDRIGRREAAVAFALLASAGQCATGLVPVGGGAALLAARGLTGIGIGGFVAPSFTLLVESSEPSRKGAASVAWTWGYVAGVVLLCGLHLGMSTAGVGWRAEEVALGAWGATFSAATLLFVTESPAYLLASGATFDALESARRIARWNGVDLDASLETEAALEPLRRAFEQCALVEELELAVPVPAAGLAAGPAAAGPAAASMMAAASVTATSAAAAAPAEQQPSSGREAADASTAGASLADLAAVEEACTPLEETYEWNELFTSERLPLTLTFGVMEAAYNMAFYTIIFAAGKLSDQLLLNLVLLAAADLPGSTLAGVSSDKIGAQKTAFRFLGAAALVLIAFAGFEGWLASGPPAAEQSDLAWLLELTPAALSLLGKSLCSGAFTAIFLLFNECYPVKLRSAALGAGMFFGKFGASCAAPLTTSLPLLGALGISGGLLMAASAGASTLPESRVKGE